MCKRARIKNILAVLDMSLEWRASREKETERKQRSGERKRGERERAHHHLRRAAER